MAFGSVNVPGRIEDLVGFGMPTATVDANVGTPNVEVQASGPDKVMFCDADDSLIGAKT